MYDTACDYRGTACMHVRVTAVLLYALLYVCRVNRGECNILRYSVCVCVCVCVCVHVCVLVYMYV